MTSPRTKTTTLHPRTIKSQIFRFPHMFPLPVPAGFLCQSPLFSLVVLPPPLPLADRFCPPLSHSSSTSGRPQRTIAPRRYSFLLRGRFLLLLPAPTPLLLAASVCFVLLKTSPSKNIGGFHVSFLAVRSDNVVNYPLGGCSTTF